MSKIFLALLLKRASKSLTSWLGTAVAGTGVVAAIDPQILAMIPENLRGYVVAAVGLAVVLARHRQELSTIAAEAKAVVANRPK